MCVTLEIGVKWTAIWFACLRLKLEIYEHAALDQCATSADHQFAFNVINCELQLLMSCVCVIYYSQLSLTERERGGGRERETDNLKENLAIWTAITP